MPLTVKTAEGKLLDTVRLVSGKLHYDTGVAEDIFEARRNREELNDPDLYKSLSGWSNGYIVIKEKG